MDASSYDIGVEMKKSVLYLFVLSLAAASIVAAGGASASGSGPSGLTAYGRTVWNLDALLHDTFGKRTVYLNAKASYPRTPRNFSTKFIDNAHSEYYIRTFANVQVSTFQTVGPTRPPKPDIGASGYEVPLTIRGAYIYCGGNKWLFEHGGNGPANWQISCHR
jgi:hypothetical protein